MPNPSKTFFYSKVIKNIKEFKLKSNIKNILDVGCGEAQFYPFFKDKKYLGIDIDTVKIKKIKKKYPECNIKKINFNYIKLKKKFNLILCLEVNSLNDFKNPKKSLIFLKKLFALLSINGFLILNFWKKYYFRNEAIVEKFFKDNKIIIVKKIQYGFFDKNINFIFWKILHNIYSLFMPFIIRSKKKNVYYVLLKK